MSKQAHAERESIREEVRAKLQNASPEEVVKELIMLMNLVAEGQVIFSFEGSQDDNFLEKISVCVNSVIKECRKSPPDFIQIREKLKLLFDETHNENLWVRGLIVLKGDKQKVQYFRSASTVFWEVIEKRFEPKRVLSRQARIERKQKKRNRK